MKNNKSVVVIGLGYVGLPLALLAEKKGYKITGIDLNQEKVDKINRRICPFNDDYLQKILTRSSLTATTDFSVVTGAASIVICVPTPVYDNRLPDYRPVESACRSIATYLQKGQLVVLESTVNPGVSEEIIRPLLEVGSGLVCGRDFSLAHCPERINPGDPKWRVDNIPRVVGGIDRKSLKKALDFYTSIIEAPVKAMNSIREAEAVKVTENSFRNINIAFVNELARSFAVMGIDVVNVIEGAATKPFSFMPHFPGCGIGGHCIPVDPYYLIDYAKKNGFDHELLRLSCRVNEGMPGYTVDLLEKSLTKKQKSLRGSTVTLLGLSYKADIDDSRESPSFVIKKELEKRGARVVVFDPFLPSMSTASCLEAALKSADGVILATNHKFFLANLTPALLKKNNISVIIDGRNCLSKAKFIKAGLDYSGIGR